MNLTPECIGVLKGASMTAALFTAGIAVGLFFLHRKHEEALNKMESETARFCLDMAAEHYEGVILRREKATAKARTQNLESLVADTDAFQKEVDAMNNYEEPDKEWEAMHKEVERHIAESAALMQQIAKKDADLAERIQS